MFNSKKDFMKYIKEEYGDIDWDNIPPLDAVKDIYIVSGRQKEGEILGCEVRGPSSLDKELKTLQSAKKAAEKAKKWKEVICKSVKIKKAKPEKLVWLHMIKDIKDMVEVALEHEMEVTKNWEDIAKLAKDEDDSTTFEFAQWFLKEQIEEEDKMRTIIEKIELDMPKYEIDCYIGTL